MRTIAFALRSLSRDLRAGELTVLVAAIVLAVMAMTAVGFFTERVGRAVKAQASEVLAADLVVRAPAPLDDSPLAQARLMGLKTAEGIVFTTMATAGEQNALSTVQAVSQGYPLRGEIKVSAEMFGDGTVTRNVPARGEAWAEPSLLARLGIEVGARLGVGSTELTVTQVLQYLPDQNPGLTVLAPGMLVNIDDVPAMDVVRPGSRVTFRQFYAGEDENLRSFREWLEPNLPSDAVMRDRENASEQINSAIDRAERFLTLASLVTVVLAAVATAMAARRYALRHLDTVALLKSVGATQGFIQRAALVELLVIVAGTAIVGSVLGFVAQNVLGRVLGGLLKVELPDPAPTAAWLGLVTSATVAIGFAFPHLMQLRRTPPMRVLRRDLPPPPLSAGITYGIAVAALVAMIWVIVRDLELVGFIVGGLLALALVAALAGWGLVALLNRFRGAAGVAWRYGLANISRRGGESVVQIVAFGLGLMVLLLLTVVRNDLLAEWQRTLPTDAPNYFFINIDPETWPEMEKFLTDELGRAPQFLPFIRGRVTRINDKPIQQVQFKDFRASGMFRGETNLTWADELPASNEVRDGKWWGAGYEGPPQLSLEQRFAASAGIEVGDTLSFNIGGEEFSAPVTSLRFVEWDSFAPNFYVMISPGLAQELPQTYLASAFVAPEQRQSLNRLVRKFPGITVFDLESILAQVRTVIDRASMAVQYVFLFTLLAGVMVMLAAVQVTRDERRFESAILHALGADRRTILQGVAVEFTALGALAGALAALGATGIGLVLAQRVFDLDYVVSPALWPAGLVLGSLLVGVTGTLATRKAVNEPPVAVLRDA
jgi:putative ABC transport system permease protein